MTLSQIIREVRYCIDEESADRALFGGVPDDSTMDRIIASKIKDAVIWLSANAPVQLLYNTGNDSDDERIQLLDFIFQYDFQQGQTLPLNVTVHTDGHATIQMPTDFLRLVRVRCQGWHRAVMTPLEEDSERYIQLADTIPTATPDRPEAAVIRTKPAQLEVWPYALPMSITIIQIPDELSSIDFTSEEAQNINVNVPSQAASAFIYYIAFLVMAAYNDTVKAKSMLEIAKMQLAQPAKQ